MVVLSIQASLIAKQPRSSRHAANTGSEKGCHMLPIRINIKILYFCIVTQKDSLIMQLEAMSIIQEIAQLVQLLLNRI